MPEPHDPDHAELLREVLLADHERREQAGWAALCEVGPEPEQATCRHLDWLTRWMVAAEAAFKRLN